MSCAHMGKATAAFRFIVLAVPALSGLAGCGPAGPEVRLAPEAIGWSPVRVALLAPAVKGDATGTLKSLPEGMTMPTREEAGEGPAAALEVLEAAGMRGIFAAAVAAGARRSTELAQEFGTL